MLYVNGTTTRKHTYTWGADYGTGGVGALIACRKHSNGKDHVYFYDGHGNVTQIMNQSGNIVAHYEYDAFGNLTKNVDQDGSGFNNENPFRFSTKFFNDETGHYYYGYRYYDPRDGRWLNRDPIGEHGGANLYAFVGNDGVNWLDYLGLKKPKTIKVEKCQAYLYIGHGSKSNPIDWDLNGMCAIGGAVSCFPEFNQPVDPPAFAKARADSSLGFPSDPVWPRTPRHPNLLHGGPLGSKAASWNTKNYALMNGLSITDPAAEHGIRQAILNALSRSAEREIQDSLCERCCDEVEIIIEIDDDKLWKADIAAAVSVFGYKPGKTYTKTLSCP